MITAGAVRTAIYLYRLGITLLLFAFRSDMAQLSSIMADVIALILKDGVCHVVILPDIFLISPGFPLLMIRKLDIASDPVLFEIQQVLFTAVAAVGSHRLQGVSKRIPVLFQNGDQRMIVCPVITHISVDYKIILYRDLDIVCRL